MAAEIFISFASKDLKVAMTLCTALENRGFSCWISARDIQPGENFQVSIVRALRHAKVMLLVFTANSNTSEEMTKELALASQQKIMVIPLRVEDVAPNDAFAYEFATRQWIDAFADWETSLDQLARRVAYALQGEAAAAPTATLEAPAPIPEPEPVMTVIAAPPRAARRPRPESEAPEPPAAEAAPAATAPEAAAEAELVAEPEADEEAAPRPSRRPLILALVGAAAVVAALAIAVPMMTSGKSPVAAASPPAVVAAAAPAPAQAQAASPAAAPPIPPTLAAVPPDAPTPPQATADDESPRLSKTANRVKHAAKRKAEVDIPY